MSDAGGASSDGASTSSAEDTALDVLIPSDSSDDESASQRVSRGARAFDGGSEPLTLSVLARLLALSLALSACVVGTELAMLWASRFLSAPVALSGPARSAWVALRLLSLCGALNL